MSRSNIEGENVLYCYIENTSNCKERHVSHSSPVFCTAKYRGGVQRTEGLILTAQKLMKSFQPLSSETTVSSVSPLYFSATQGRRLQCFILPYKNSSDYNKSKKCVTLLPCARICDRGGGRRGKKTGEKYKIYP